MTPRLLLATTNPDKLREIKAILAHLPLEIVTLRDFAPLPDPEETGTTFAQNARLKALYYDAATETDPKVRSSDNIGSDVGSDVGADLQVRPRYTVAEDSGLVIDALGGEPGVYSARFLRVDASYPERFAEIYRRLEETPTRARTARFVCALAVVHTGTVVYETTGIVEGVIAGAPSGTGGFGYDPIFHYPPFGRTLADVPEDVKLGVAHRGKAFRQLAGWIEGA